MAQQKTNYLVKASDESLSTALKITAVLLRVFIILIECFQFSDITECYWFQSYYLYSKSSNTCIGKHSNTVNRFAINS